jgi:hypothetical protein
VRGLFGNFDGDPANDVATRGGAVLKLPEWGDPAYREVMYCQFGDSWRVPADASLFDRPAQKQPPSCHDFPATVATMATIPALDRARADALCRAANLRDVAFLDDCTFDVGLTGNPAFALQAAEAASAALLPGSSESFAISIGMTVQPDQPSPGAGRIDQPRAVDRYAFEATTGQIVYLDALDSCTPNNVAIQWSMVDPSGEPVSSVLKSAAVPACFDFGRIAIRQGGTYTIEVSAAGVATGDYSFVVRDVPLDGHYQIAVGDSVGPDQPASGAGIIDAPGAIDRYTLDAPEGTVVYAQMTEPCREPYLTWSMTAADGRLLPTKRGTTVDPICFDLDGVTLTGPPPYQIVVGATADQTGRYGFKVWKVPPVEQFVISPGVEVGHGSPGPGAGSIESPGAVDHYTFQGTAGRTLAVNVLSAPTDCRLRYSILDPHRDTVTAGQILCHGLEGRPVRLTLTGSYELIVVGNAAATGPYTFRLAED